MRINRANCQKDPEKQGSIAFDRLWQHNRDHPDMNEIMRDRRGPTIMKQYGLWLSSAGVVALAADGYDGSVVLEVNTRKARNPQQRADMLAEALLFARLHLEPLGA